MMQNMYPLKTPSKTPHITPEKYFELYNQSITNPDGFWAEKAEEFLTWNKKFDKVKNTCFAPDNVSIKWFEGGKLNVCYNCIDRHLAAKANQIAIIWEGDNPQESKKITYKQLHSEVCKFANILKNLGVKKGDVVTIYLPMILEAAYAMLACARIGAIHSVVFGGFSPEALKGRVEDGKSKIVITADEGLRGGKKIPLKANVDEAIRGLENIKCLIIKRTGGKINFNPKTDFWYDEEIKKTNDDCEIEIMESEDPLFILYTSGSTGKPKGLLHTTAGYLLYSAITHKYVFDYEENDIYWCTADVGWITGHSYIIYGPLANGGTTLMFEGVPTYPDNSRFWQVIDKYNVTQFYTAPTAIRMLMGAGDDFVKKTSRKSLRILGSVGEPINPEAWRWYYEVVGNSNCPIVDTYWQTETGGHIITPLPYAIPQKAGSASFPFFGIKPVLLDDKGELTGDLLRFTPHPTLLPQSGGGLTATEGNLCITDSWPGQARTIWGDHQRFVETYFKPFSNKYFTGDGAKLDEDGYFWITGRVDDVINVSGHRIGTAEIEGAIG
jgi:acetyl-CoA synthetase